MAITLRPQGEQAPAFTDVFSNFQLEQNDSPASRRALMAGILGAKREAHDQAARLIRYGRPLLIAIIFISATHMIETIAGYKPATVGALHLWTALYHATAILFTLGIDLTALFLVAAGGAASLAGAPRRPWPVRFFLLTTFLLNAAYIVRYAPSLAQSIKDQILPYLDAVFVLLLPAAVVVAIPAIETARATLEAAKLKLSVDIVKIQTELEGGVKKPNNASQAEKTQMAATAAADDVIDAETISGDPLEGRRPVRYTLATLSDAIEPGEQLTRKAIIERVGFSGATADRLIRQAVDGGLLQSSERGVYQRV